jgi:ADP-ribose pyrophosphatase
MNITNAGQNPPVAALDGDRRCVDVDLRSERLVTGFRHYDRFAVTLAVSPSQTMIFERDVLRSGLVVGVLPVDIDRKEIVLVRQFRLGAHLGCDLGEMVEIVAGRVDAGESSEDAARRECGEEIGVVPATLVRLLQFAPAPALTDEFMQLYLARVDAGAAPARAGLSHEGEELTILRYPLAEVPELLSRGAFHSGPTLVALHWLTVNMAAVDRYLG